MREHKSNPQYGTLDVLLMMLLYNAKNGVKIPAEVFKKHSLFFANYHTVSVSVCWPDKEDFHSGVVTLKCTNKQKLQRLIDKYQSLYRKNRISSTERVRGCEKTDTILERFILSESCKRSKIIFEFTSTNQYERTSITKLYPLDTASFIMACSYNGFPVKGVAGKSPSGKWYEIVEIDSSALWDNVRCHIPTGWRVRLDSPNASYLGHQIQFDKSTDKQKKLLDMLVSAKNGVVRTDDVIKNIPIDDTNRKGKRDKKFALQNIRGLHREIQRKVKAQCKKDGYGQPYFRIEVGEDFVRLIDSSPV